MSTIRKQSIFSSLVVYIGFALGFVNTYLFAREGGFTKEQYGLTALFIAVANVLYSFASMGMPAYVSKFFPYYKDHLKPSENDMLTRALGIAVAGFGVATFLGIVFKDFVLMRFNNSPLLQEYYYWVFPFGLGYTIFMVLEVYGWHEKVPVLTNFLKELLSRLMIAALVLLTSAGIIASFDTFVHLYSFFYVVIAAILLIYLFRSGKVQLVFKRSKVTRRYWPKILLLCSFVWGGGLILNLSSVFDTIVVAAVLPEGLAQAGVFTLAQNIASLIQAPQRGIIASAVGPLSKAWKDKDYDRINRIYHRSSINQLLFACGMFSLIWLNFEDGIYTFNLQEGYLQAKWVFLFIGLYRVIDMGTGLNAQIIGTSTFWKFEFISGLVLFALALPLNYFLTKSLGLIGPGISNLVAFTVYNAYRCWFLYSRFKMQPFTKESLFTLLLTVAAFAPAYFLFNDKQGFIWIILRSTLFCAVFVAGIYGMKLTPDLEPVLSTLKKRMGIGSRS